MDMNFHVPTLLTSTSGKVDSAQTLFSHAVSKLEGGSLGRVDLHLAVPTGMNVGYHQLLECIDTT